MENLTSWHRQVAASIAAAHPLETAPAPRPFLVQIKRGKLVQESFTVQGTDSVAVATEYRALVGPGQILKVTAAPVGGQP